MTLYVDWAVKVNGKTVTRKMNPYILEIECAGNEGGRGDTARLVFKDTAGEMILPAPSSQIEILILGRRRFRGVTDAPEIVVARGGGQTIEVNCSGFDRKGKPKEGQRWSKDDCILEDFLGEAAKKAGVSGIKIDPEFAKIKRPYWSTLGRSFLQLGQALADELGGTFVIRGDKAVLAKRGSGSTPGGNATPTIYARRPGNLITGRIAPYQPRAQFSKTRVRYYDRKAAKWKYKDVEVGEDPAAGGPVDHLGDAKPDADSAERAAKGRKAKSEREGGGGSVVLLIEVMAEVEGTIIVEGVRDGADGPYRISGWRDRVTRKGAETTVNFKQPQGKAGKDSRRKGSGSGSGSGAGAGGGGVTGRNNDAGLGGGPVVA